MSDRSNGGDGSLLDFPLPRFPAGSFKLVPLLIVLLLLAVLAWNTVYIVSPEEIAIVLRLGEYRGREHDQGPGLRWKLPFIDQVMLFPVERQLKEEFGFRTEEAGVRSSFRKVLDEANMLTGDLNAAEVEWVVQYRIVDPYSYVFRVRNVESTFRDMSEAVMRRIIGDRAVSEVLTIGRAEIEGQVKEQLQALCDQYETGIRVDQVVLQSNNPPDPVKPSFNEVNQAEQESERLINEAQAQYNRVIPAAEGQALRTIEQAEGYALDRVNRAEGEAARFTALYQEYRSAPEVTRKRFYLEAMGDVLENSGQKIVVDGDLDGLVPFLDMGAGAVQGVPAAAAAAAAGAAERQGSGR